MQDGDPTQSTVPDEVGAGPRRARLRLAGRDPVDRRLIVVGVAAVALLGAVLLAHWWGAVDTGTSFAPLDRAISPMAAVAVLAASAGGVAALVGWARHTHARRARLLLVVVGAGQLWLVAASHAGVSLVAALVDAVDLGVVDVGDAWVPQLRTDVAWTASYLGMAAAVGIATIRRETLAKRPALAIALAVTPQAMLVAIVAALGMDLEVTAGATGIEPGTTVVLRDVALSQLTNALVGLGVPVAFLFMFEALESSRLARDVGAASAARGRASWRVVAATVGVKVAILAVGFTMFSEARAWRQARDAGLGSWLLATGFVAAAAWWLRTERRTPAGMDRAATAGGLVVVLAWLAPGVVTAVLLAARQLVPVVVPSSSGGIAASIAVVALVAAGHVAGRPTGRRATAGVVAAGGVGALVWSTGARDRVVAATADLRTSVGDRVVEMAERVSESQVTLQAVLLLLVAVAAAAIWRRSRGVALALAVFWLWNLVRMVDVLCLQAGWCDLDLLGLLVRPVQLDVVITAAAIGLLLVGRRARLAIGPAATTGALVAITVVLHAGSLVMQSTEAPLFYAGLLLPTAYLLLFDARELNPPNDGATSLALSSLGIVSLSMALVALQLLSGQVEAGQDNAGDVAAVLLLVPLTATLLGASLRGPSGDLWHDAMPPVEQADTPS